MSKVLHILAGLLALGLLVAGGFAFADLQSEDQIAGAVLAAMRAQASPPLGVEVFGGPPSDALVAAAAQAGLAIRAIPAVGGADERAVLRAPLWSGMFGCSVRVEHYRRGGTAGSETDYVLAWNFGWRVTAQRKVRDF